MPERTPGMATPAPAGARPRLNPFALPSETTFRFVLLVVAVIATSLFIANWLYLSWGPADQAATLQRCLLEASEASDPFEARAILADCTGSSDRLNALSVIGGTAALMVVATIVYWLLPALKLRRRRLEPISEDELPEGCRPTVRVKTLERSSADWAS